MKRLVTAALAWLLLCAPAFAGSKTPLANYGGGAIPIKSSDALQTSAPTTANASINLPHGTAPTSPNNGDCWTTTAGLFCRVNGATVGPYGPSTGPGGTNGQIQYNNSGAFGGFTAAGDCTFSVPNFTCTKTAGVAFAYFATGTDASHLTGTLPCSSVPALTGDVTTSSCAATIGANKVTLGDIAQIGADTYLGNAGGSTANVAAVSWPSCSASGNALIYNTTSHAIGCQNPVPVTAGDPIAIGTAQIGSGSGQPPLTTFCTNSAGEGSLCLRTDLGYAYSMWDPPSAIPARVQEAVVIDTYAITLGASPTLGNYLVAFGYSSAAIPTVAAGWTSISTHTDGGAGVNAVLAYHLVVPGDTTSQTPFTTAGSCFGAAVIEVSGLDMTTFANSLQANAYGENSNVASASVSFSPTTSRANTLGVAFSGAERNGGCAVGGLSTPTISAGWTNTVTATGGVSNNAASLVSSQAFPSNGSTASATVTNSSAAGARMTAAQVLLQPSTDTQTTGFQQVGYFTTFKNGGSTISANARSLNCSTGTTCSTDADGNITLTASGTGVTSVATSGLLTGGPITTTGTISIASIAADAIVGNFTGSSASPTSQAIPNCVDTGGNHLNYATSTHSLSCGSSGGGGGSGLNNPMATALAMMSFGGL